MKDKKNKFEKNNKVELQNTSLLYIEEENNNNLICAFLIIIINKLEIIE